MTAATTPRVRTLVVCDGIRSSRLEENVFHLRGARSHVVADTFPFRRRLHLFLILSSPRAGRYPSYVKVINEQNDQAVFYGQVDPAPIFPIEADLLPLDLPISIRFPAPGRYMIQVWFFQETVGDVLKMEQPIHVLQDEA